MSSFVPLTDDSTLEHLFLESAQVECNTLGSVVAKQFEQRSNLSGVLILDRMQVIGMISRRLFHQSLSQPYAIEIFLKRPIQVFLDLNPHCYKPLQLSYTEKIDAAVRKGLNRPFEDLFDPIVVEFHHPKLPQLTHYFLLDFHRLMLAQSQVLAYINGEMTQQKSLLEQEQRKTQDYANQLESQQQVIQDRNHLLETQHQKLLEQSEEIQTLNQKFISIGKVLSQEGKKAFQATFAGVNAICHNTDQIVSIGRLLESELETIHDTSTSIEEISRQVRHLSVQAAIVVNQSDKGLRGFTYIAEEITKLTKRTSEAGRQMNILADRFQQRVQSFTESAQSGTTVARSLIREIEQAAIALSELEQLVQAHDILEPRHLTLSTKEVTKQKEMEVLSQKLALAESTLSDLRHLIEDQTVRSPSSTRPTSLPSQFQSRLG